MTRDMAPPSLHRRLQPLPRAAGLLVVVVAAAIVLLAAAPTAEGQHTPQQDAQHEAPRRRHPSLPVLGYVTPWNPRGKQLVEDHRHKFDMVSPVWYTVHAPESDDDNAHDDNANDDAYEIRGGPPDAGDEAWYRRLQQPSPPVRITPRFVLDGWGQDAYRALVFNATRWQLLADAITRVVRAQAYDGVVFEAGAIHALAPALAPLAAALLPLGATLVVVVPPVRTLGDDDDDRFVVVEAHNAMLLQALPQLARVADYLSVMTYDMTGPGGRAVRRSVREASSMIALAARNGNVREPGPNTSADWVVENLVAFVEASAGVDDQQQQQQFQLNLELQQASRKFLMGLPLYGYKYPILYIDKATGDVVQPTRVDPDPAYAIMTGPAAPKASYIKPAHSVPILSGSGEPVVATEIADIVKEHKPEMFQSDPEGEYYFDYQRKRGEGWWRVFLPTGEGIAHVLDAINGVVDDDLQYSFGGAGVALWEVGQGSDELLAAL